MVKTQCYMTLDYYNEFYLIEALKANILFRIAENPRLEFSRSVEKLSQDIEEYEKRVIPNMALRTFTYLFAACAGEARHAVHTQAKTMYIDQLRGGGRKEVFSTITEYPPDKENVSALVEIFRQDWRSSFGGEAWHNIAESLKMFYEVPPAAFLDHVIDLEHNNGTVFSKTEAEQFFFKVKYRGNFRDFLDFKFNKDLLNNNPFQEVHITRKARSFVDRYIVIFKVAKSLKWLVPSLPPLDEYEIEWGNRHFTIIKKWFPWASCEGGNDANLRYAVYLGGMSEILPQAVTRKEYLEAIEKICARTRKILERNNIEKKFSVKEYLTSHYNQTKHRCKLNKQDVTYAVLPVKVKTVEYEKYNHKILIQVPAKYYGIGRKTKYGFLYSGSTNGIVEDTGKERGFDGTRGWNDGIITSRGHHMKIIVNGHNWWYTDKKLEAILS